MLGWVCCFCVTTALAQRVISLAPDLTETLFAIGAGASVVGVVSGSDYPSAVKHVTVVGSYSGLDLEKIMALRPDLIVAWGGLFSRQLSVLKALGIPVYASNPQRLEDQAVIMRQLGHLTGNDKRANEQALVYLQRLAQLRQAYQGVKRRTVFYQIGAYSLVTINKDSWISQIISLCGGDNVFANAVTIAPTVSWEAVVAADPQVIMSDTMQTDWKKRWQAWSSMTAVKRHNMVTVEADLIERLSPRVLDGALQLCKQLKSTTV
jgi:iron complex transport system substrate-binding protein